MNFNRLILTNFKCLFNKNYQKFILKSELSLKMQSKIRIRFVKIHPISYLSRL